MSLPQFPLHPESVPPRIAYSPGHRQWLDENRVKRHRKAFLKFLVDREIWWNMIKVLAIPATTAIIVAWVMISITPSNATLMPSIKVNIIGASIGSCVTFGFYVDFWTAKVKTRGDRNFIRILGVASGALIGLTGVLISLIHV